MVGFRGKRVLVEVEFLNCVGVWIVVVCCIDCVVVGLMSLMFLGKLSLVLLFLNWRVVLL